MWTCEAEIKAAISTIGLDPNGFNKIADDLSLPILNTIEQCFVTGRPKNWWWESFRQTDAIAQHKNDQAFEWLDQILPTSANRVWFVTEPDNDNNKYGLYNALPINIKPVLNECCYFEYYIVSQELDWLVCETHHGVIMVIGDSVANRLQQLVLDYPKEWVFKDTAYKIPV
jgi:hypothetical protein